MDKALLFKSRLNEAEVEVPGIGTVRVRALSRFEVMECTKSIKSQADAFERTAELERKLLSRAMVDPELTEAEVGKWQKAATAGEMEPVLQKVQELSGTGDGAAKEAYKEFEADPAAEFRLPPSA